MESFFVNKTGADMFDAFRAYGLGFLLQGIGREEDLEITIRDMNYAFVLNLKGDIPNSPDEQSFTTVEDSWRRVFSTYRVRRDSKKPHPKQEVRRILTEEFDKILDIYRAVKHLPKIGGSVKGGKTLYQSLDLSAAKGFREQKLGSTYHDGTQIKVDPISWALACFGAAFVGSWQSGKDFIVSLVPNPNKVTVESHRQIREDLKTEKICNLSANVALAHYSVKLSEMVARMKSGYGFINYNSVIFNVMRKTGQQAKPSGGGKYGLTFLNKVVNEDFGVETLQRINKLFRMGFVKGIKQDIAFAFADFLIHPNLETFRRCEDLYIRGCIKENLALWGRAEMEAILKHAEAV
jgi:hypothetical protein